MIWFVLLLSTSALMGQPEGLRPHSNPGDLISKDTVGFPGFKTQISKTDSLVIELRNKEYVYDMPVIPLKPAEPMPNLNVVKPGVEYYILNSMGPHHYQLPGTPRFKHDSLRRERRE